MILSVSYSFRRRIARENYLYTAVLGNICLHFNPGYAILAWEYTNKEGLP
ncbi:hypothetical protein HMPREF0372_01959 [Flavonifractor plautii ATCC 29863]|uniref:Uncharacterized protein n=1 Tax=Flavonifractor plautii ATCC 29863 TaxID=411475 RepID=G9YR16_FLAPL|nr:hypothetical protein HMPREF0372_01959 [Flavonifractor plautii ATCC 29863]